MLWKELHCWLEDCIMILTITTCFCSTHPVGNVQCNIYVDKKNGTYYTDHLRSPHTPLHLSLLLLRWLMSTIECFPILPLIFIKILLCTEIMTQDNRRQNTRLIIHIPMSSTPSSSTPFSPSMKPTSSQISGAVSSILFAISSILKLLSFSGVV